MTGTTFATSLHKIRYKTPSNRGRRFLSKENPKATYSIIQGKNKTKKTKFSIDKVRTIIHALCMDATKEEACTLAFIHPNTFDNWYASNLEILWEFTDNFTKEKEKKMMRFKALVDRALLQPYVLAREVIYHALTNGNQKAAMWFLQRRDPRYSARKEPQQLQPMIVKFGGPKSPFVKTQ